MNVETGLSFKSNTFEGIWANQLIEHLENPLITIKEFYRVLKPNGKLICITPDFINTCLKTSSKKEYEAGFHKGFWDDYTHKRPFTPASLYQLAYDAGFRNIKITHFFKYLRGSRKLVNANLIDFKRIVKLHEFYLILEYGIKTI